MGRKRPRGFTAGYKPRANAELLDAVKAVLAEYEAQLPMTLRQIFYRLIGRFGYEKTERAYERLCEMLNLARRGGVIPFDHIRDDGNVVMAPPLWGDGEQWLEAIVRSAGGVRLSPWPDQPRYVEVICEAGGMAPMLSRVADPYGVTVRSGGGFDSVTAKHDLAQHYARQGKPVTVLHVGDFDPSGEALWVNLNEDVGAFCEALGAEFVVKRVAVTPEQQERYGLEGAPAKKKDEANRKAVWRPGEQAVQAEALPPDLLQEIVEEAIKAEMNLDALAATKQQQEEVRADLAERLQGLMD